MVQYSNLSALGLLALALGASALPSLRHAVHEKRAVMPAAWMRDGRLDADTVLPVRIGLAQSNLDRGHDALMGVSDPDSPDFLKHWSMEEVADFFAPAAESVDAVMDWVKSAAGSRVENLRHSLNRGWVEFDAPAADVETLLNTEYHLYKHHETGASAVGCSEYSVPEHLRNHIDIITPTLHFDARPEGPGYDQHKKRAEARALAKRGMFTTIKPGRVLSNLNPDIAQGTGQCDATITPACLRALYNIPKGSLNLSTFGIVEYGGETFLQSDLDKFWATKGLNDAFVPAGTHATYTPVDGGFLEPASDASFGINGEADLDLEYAIDLAYPQQVTLFQVGDNGTNAYEISFNNFLDALDASYCTYDGGDDPTEDETFPDPGKGGYHHKEQCGAYKAPAVISTSYGYNEHDLTPAYEARQCYEYMKLGLAGTSFVYSSGDYGVAGNGGQCIDPATGQYNNGSTGMFNPAFPSVCPYVTSVGATQIAEGNSVAAPEEACETVIYSGGGFSNNFAMPGYQAAAVKTYFAAHKPTYTAQQYNNSMTSRGFPDVAANGANYIITLDGYYQFVFGTSASAPVFASIISLINNQRAQAGKGSLGFLNPLFYKHPNMFNDITSGGNQGCGTPGFTAVSGWDPVTGLGTPDYTKMAKVLVAA